MLISSVGPIDLIGIDGPCHVLCRIKIPGRPYLYNRIRRSWVGIVAVFAAVQRRFDLVIIAPALEVFKAIGPLAAQLYPALVFQDC